MTIYFAGDEDIDVTTLGTPAWQTGTNQYRSAFARGAYSGRAGAYPLTVAATVTAGWTPVSTFWAHTRMGNNNNNATSSGGVLLAFLDAAGGVGRLLVSGTGTAGQVAIVKRNAAGTLTTLVTSAAGAIPGSASGVPNALDFFVNYAVSGQATLYVNGVSVADTGAGVDVTTDGATGLGQMVRGGMSSGNDASWSETIVQDSSTIGISLWTNPPVASGATQSWTPNTVGNINEATINDSNFIAASTANALSEWTVSTTFPTGSWGIEAVIQKARVLVGATGPQHFSWVVRTADGSDHTTGSVAPTTSFANYANYAWLQNPHTVAPWQPGDLIDSGLESLT